MEQHSLLDQPELAQLADSQPSDMSHHRDCWELHNFATVPYTVAEEENHFGNSLDVLQGPVKVSGKADIHFDFAGNMACIAAKKQKKGLEDSGHA